MSSHKRFQSPSVAAFTTALAASLQGIDRLPPDDRSSKTVLSLLDHVLQAMHAGTPELRPVDRREMRMLRSQLQDAIEARDMWMDVPVSPADVIH